MKNSVSEQVTIFVCVKVRAEGKSSCGGCGSRQLVEALRQRIQASGDKGVTVRPAGCLKKCKKGPIAVVFGSEEGLMKKPPRKPWKKADARFKRVSAKDVASIAAAASTRRVSAKK